MIKVFVRISSIMGVQHCPKGRNWRQLALSTSVKGPEEHCNLSRVESGAAESGFCNCGTLVEQKM